MVKTTITTIYYGIRSYMPISDKHQITPNKDIANGKNGI